jgi:ubiquinone/menaquinone biosynthesis C-methylase UbiE
MGVFEALGRKAHLAAEVAKKMRADVHGISLLLDALSAQGLIERRGNFYRNRPEGRVIFDPRHEKYVGDIMALQASSWQDWGTLARSVRRGRPLALPPFLRQSKRATRTFIRAMHNTAVGHAAELASCISLRGRRHLLDVGGGPGTFSVYFLKANRGLKATIFDLPGTVAVGREIVRSYKMEKRIAFQTGDFHKDPIRGRYDAVFLSHIIHGLSEGENRRLIMKIAAVLEKGGELLIQDFFLNDDGVSPEFAALFSLNMLLHTRGGKSYTFHVAESWLREAGFSKIERLPHAFARSIRILRGVK